MQEQQRYELYLNHMSAWEHARKDTFREYAQLVYFLLQVKDHYHFEDDILKEYEAANMKEIIETHPDKFVHNGMSVKRHEADQEYIRVWFDLWDEEYIIQPGDYKYEDFFAYKLRQLSLIELDSFLSYQLKKYYGNNLQKFGRLVNLVMRQHGAKLLAPDIMLTVSEWIEQQEKQSPVILNGTEAVNPEQLKDTIREVLTENNKPDKSTEPEILTIDEAAAFLKISKATVYEKTSEKKIPHFKKGNRLYFYRTDLEAWIREGKVKTHSEIEGDAATYILRKKGKR